MQTKQPNLGDRVLFFNPNCEADRVGTVIAKRETRFGVDWEVELDEGAGTEYVNNYSGTATDRGGYYVPNERGGIGHYLIEGKS